MENRKKKVSVTESSSVHKVHAKDVDEINEPHYRSYKDDLKAEKRSYRGIQEIIILNNQLIRLCSHSSFIILVIHKLCCFCIFTFLFILHVLQSSTSSKSVISVPAGFP